ncbi:MAG: hypothetical protein RLZZ511_821 [Cyanobacteriota bacterium]|jgi:hypothetical protein
MIHFLKSRGSRRQSLAKIDQPEIWDGALSDTSAVNDAELDDIAAALTDEEAAEIQVAFQQQVDDATLLSQLLNDSGDGELAVTMPLVLASPAAESSFDRDLLDLSQVSSLTLDAEFPITPVLPVVAAVEPVLTDIVPADIVPADTGLGGALGDADQSIDLDLMQPEVTVASIDGLMDLQLPVDEAVANVANAAALPANEQPDWIPETNGDLPELAELTTIQLDLSAVAEPAIVAAVPEDVMDLEDVADLADLELPGADLPAADVLVANSDFAVDALVFDGPVLEEPVLEEPVLEKPVLEETCELAAVEDESVVADGVMLDSLSGATADTIDPSAIDWSPTNWAMDVVDQTDVLPESALDSAPLSYFQYYLGDTSNDSAEDMPASYVTPWHQPSVPGGLIGAGVLGATLVSGFVIADTVKTQPTLTAKKPTPTAPLQGLSARDQVAAKVTPKTAPPESLTPEMTLPKPKTSLGTASYGTLSPIATLTPSGSGGVATLPTGGSNAPIGNLPATGTTGAATTSPTAATKPLAPVTTQPLQDLPEPQQRPVQSSPIANPPALELPAVTPAPPATEPQSAEPGMIVGDGTRLLPAGTPLIPPSPADASALPIGKAADLATTPATNPAVTAPTATAPVATASAPAVAEPIVPTLEADATPGEPVALRSAFPIPDAPIAERMPAERVIPEQVFERPAAVAPTETVAPAPTNFTRPLPDSAPTAAPILQPISDRAAPVAAQLLVAQASDRPVLQASNLDDRQGRILTAREAEMIQTADQSLDYQLQRLGLAEYTAAYQRLNPMATPTSLPMFGFIDYQRKLVVLPLSSLAARDSSLTQQRSRLAQSMVEL